MSRYVLSFLVEASTIIFGVEAEAKAHEVWFIVLEETLLCLGEKSQKAQL